jgi:hypothetical protein
MLDPWEKASDCARAAEAAIDPQQRSIFTHLRDLWIALANETSFISDEQRAKEIAAMDRLHIELAAPIQSSQ